MADLPVVSPVGEAVGALGTGLLPFLLRPEPKPMDTEDRKKEFRGERCLEEGQQPSVRASGSEYSRRDAHHTRPRRGPELEAYACPAYPAFSCVPWLSHYLVWVRLPLFLLSIILVVFPILVSIKDFPDSLSWSLLCLSNTLKDF